MENMNAVRPVLPVAAYVGGKKVLSKTIIARINSIPHDGYSEAFVGMGGVFFRRDRQPRFEAINDISGDVAALFRVLQRHYGYFINELRFTFAARRKYERLLATEPTTLTDLERAARFLYLQRLAFGGKVSGRTFGVDRQRSRFNMSRLEPMLADINDRLAGVVIERLPWEAFIRRYDRPGMLFYLDPPYWGNEDDYGKGVFGGDDFARMADTLSAIRGQFILSLNAVPGVFKTFSRFSIEEVDCNYSISKGAGKAVKEVIITGGAT
jgi:DNA adenine methylase